MNINDAQRIVFSVVDEWVKTNKTPIYQQTILESVTTIPQSTVKASIRALIRKGYLRKAIERRAAYVQLRSL